MSSTTPRRETLPPATASLVESAPLSRESALAAEIKALVVAGARDLARERFADLVTLQQRRAARIAYEYLRDADEAVQDALVKVFTHIASYREDLPFEVWFTRILVNGCLDLSKARSRRMRWVLPAAAPDGTAPREPVAPQASPEDRLLSSERRHQIAAAVAQLPERQRAVFTLWPDRRPKPQRGRPGAGPERRNGSRPLVPRHPQAAGAAGARAKVMHQPHLSDDRLIDICLDRAPASSTRQHLEACDVCEGRRARLARLLTHVSDVARDEADAVFTPERLSRQHARIVQRVEQEARHGRIISFPAGQGQGPTLPRARPGMGWIAGSAAAGLVIGLVAGRFARDFQAGVDQPASQAGGPVATATLQAVSTTASEEEFLGRLEVAIEGTSGSALRPLHDLTPLVWEVSA